MISIPSFILKRLYVKNSLSKYGDGFEFKLRNSLGSGYAYKMYPLILDGNTIPLVSTFFILDALEVSFAEVDRENTFTLAINRDITIRSHNFSLGPGSHTIVMSFEVPGLGTLKFDFTDNLSNQLD